MQRQSVPDHSILKENQMRKVIKQNSRFNKIIILGGVGLTLFGCTGLGGCLPSLGHY